MIKWKKGSEDLKWVMGRNKYRPPSDRKDGRWTVGQRFVSHRDRQRDRVKTDGQDTDRQRKRFKTAGHGTKTDRQRKEIQVQLEAEARKWSVMVSKASARSKMMVVVTTLTSTLWEAARKSPCQRSTLKYCSFDIIWFQIWAARKPCQSHVDILGHFHVRSQNSFCLHFYTWWVVPGFLYCCRKFLCSAKSRGWQRADQSNLCQPARWDRRLKVKSVSETVRPNISWHFRFKGKTFDNVLNLCKPSLWHFGTDRTSM